MGRSFLNHSGFKKETRGGLAPSAGCVWQLNAVRTSGLRLDARLSRSPALAYAENSSLTSLPLLAIFIGRPLVLVKFVVSEMPNAWHTLASTSSLL